MPDFEFYRPTQLSEALRLLDDDDPAIRPMGGGTAIALMMKARFLEPLRLVCLDRVDGLRGITMDPGGAAVRIGATTTFAEIERSEELATAFPVLRHALRDIANVRVRNVATVGGNLAHADPHLDLPPIWNALGARVHLVGPGGEREIPVEDLTLGYYETCIEPGEVITGISVPLHADARNTYVKVTTRARHDWPALGLAVQARVDGGTVGDCRIVLSAATDRPIRLTAAEAVLCNGRPTPATLDEVAAAAVATVDIESDERGSREYKNHLLAVHLRRALHDLVGDLITG